MEGPDRFADTMLRDEIRRLNAHLPKKRQSLSELLAEKSPVVPTVDGGKIMMKKEELEVLAKGLPEDLHGRVKLPLVLLRRTDLGFGAFVLLGDPVEEFALLKLVSPDKDSFDDFRRKRSAPTVFYKPQVSELVRRFHSLVVIGFGVSEETFR